MRTRYLDQSSDTLIAEAVIESLTAEGYDAFLIIPGLIEAVRIIAETTVVPEEVLDEAANLLTA